MEDQINNVENNVEIKTEAPNSMYNENNKPVEQPKVTEVKPEPLTNEKLNELMAEIQKLKANQQTIIDYTKPKEVTKTEVDDGIKY